MITLYGGGAGFGLPDVSPYVTKTEVQLRMADVAYRKMDADPSQAPKGQIPFIEADGERMGDSTFIRGFLERTCGIDFDEAWMRGSGRRPGRSSGWSRTSSTGWPSTPAG
jgi:hypothetical protein